MIDSDRINEIFIDCLFKKDELDEQGKPKATFVSARGVTVNVGFHRERLYSYEKEIIEFLEDLPNEFKKSSGNDGYSFLYANKDKHGKEWTDLHERMDQLFMLGMAIEKVEFCDKWLWILLPEGLPLVTFLDDEGR
jgi:hypothetical protein